MTLPGGSPGLADGDTTDKEVLGRGALTLHGRIPHASNAVLYATATLGARTLPCVYKPVAGERPLWDFPEGSLARREVAAYLVCQALGWAFVPPTVLRDGPHGEGMCQRWVGPLPAAGPDPAPDGSASRAPDPDGPASDQLLALVDGDEPEPGWKAVAPAQVGDGREVLLVHADDDRLRQLATLDVVLNNADRKGGHLLPLADGRLFAIDHGVTFHTDDKLRTLLWGWAGEPLPPAVRDALRRLSTALGPATPLVDRLGALLAPAELEALRKRTEELLATGRHPLPGDGPTLPWPPV